MKKGRYKNSEDYKTFMYYYEGMPTKEPMTFAAKQVFVTVGSHPTVVESHSDTELHTDVKHQLDNVDLQNKRAHSDTEIEKTIKEERRIEPRLSKYVR